MIRTAAPRARRVGRARTLAFCVVAVLVAALLLAATKPAHAIDFTVVFTVNSTGDEPDASAGDNLCDVDTSTPGEQCTLRAAIEQANATTAADIIDFDIGGSGVKTISPHSQLPTITEPVTINGYSEPGASANTLAVGDDAVIRIRLDGSNIGVGAGATGLNIAADGSVVRGLSITRFSASAGILLSGADNTKIVGNFLGTSPGGTKEDLGNGWGLFLQSVPGKNPRDNTIGGTTPEARNIISGNASGITVLTGVLNKIEGNYIGTTKSGTGALGNGAHGVEFIGGSAGNTVGGMGAARNTIAFNGEDGVEIFNAAGTSILSNSIFSNAGLGIDLGDDGRTPNDLGDADTGPNNLQNFPVISSAETVGGTTTIKARLNSTPSTIFVVRFFSNPSNDNEGKRYIGSKSVTTDSNGNTGTFTFRPTRAVPVGQRITATATDPAGNTSEFSAIRKVTAS